MGEEFKKIMATYVKYPPRKQQSLTYTGPITLSNYEKFQSIRDSAGQGWHQPSDADRKLMTMKRSGANVAPPLLKGGQFTFLRR